MSTTRRVRIGVGLALAALGLWLIASPLTVAALLSRPHETTSQMINLRATWGGSPLGVGAFVAWLPAVQPWRRFLLGLAMWSMAGIGLARAVGFLLDGGPDALQWAYLIAEFAIAVLCAFALRRRATGAVTR